MGQYDLETSFEFSVFVVHFINDFKTTFDEDIGHGIEIINR